MTGDEIFRKQLAYDQAWWEAVGFPERWQQIVCIEFAIDCGFQLSDIPTGMADWIGIIRQHFKEDVTMDEVYDVCERYIEILATWRIYNDNPKPPNGSIIVATGKFVPYCGMEWKPPERKK